MKWNFTEFKTYVLLEAAHSDMDFSEEEKEVIMSKLNPETFDKIFAEFNEDSDFERIEKIRKASQFHCDTTAKKQALLDRVQFILNADGDFNTMERNMMMYLKKLI